MEYSCKLGDTGCHRSIVDQAAQHAFGSQPEQILAGFLSIARSSFEERDGNLFEYYRLLKSELPCCVRGLIRFDTLPAAVLDRILYFLSRDPVSIAKFSQVCREWHRIASISRVWQRCCQVIWSLPNSKCKFTEKLVELLAQSDFRPSLQLIGPLVRAGANLKYKHRNAKGTPLLLAAFHGHNHVLEFLLKNGSDRNETAACGKNAFMIACLRNHQSTAAWLLSQGFSIRERDACGNSPLMLAALGGSRCVMSYLKAQGVILSATNNNGSTALHTAAMGGNADAVRLLLQWNLDVDAQQQDGMTPFLVACHYGRGQASCALYQHGANKHARDKHGATALMRAALHGACSFQPAPTAAFETLITCLVTNLGIDVNATDHYGRTALFYSTFAGQQSITDLLISLGADTDVRDDFGLRTQDYRMVHRALRNQQLDRAASLLDNFSGIAMISTPKMEVREADFRALCQALKKNQTVKTLILDSSLSVESCMDSLVGLFAENRTISDLHLGYREKQQLPTRIKEYLAANRRAQQLQGLCFPDESPTA